MRIPPLSLLSVKSKNATCEKQMAFDASDSLLENPSLKIILYYGIERIYQDGISASNLHSLIRLMTTLSSTSNSSLTVAINSFFPFVPRE